MPPPADSRPESEGHRRLLARAASRSLRSPMGRMLSLVALFAVFAFGFGGPAASQVAPTTTTPAPPSDTTLDPIAPGLLERAHSDGVRAAAVIRARIQELQQARVDVARSGDAVAAATLADASDVLLRRLAEVQAAGSELDQLQFSHREVVAAYDEARSTLARHAALLYTTNPDVIIANSLLRSGDFDLALSRTHLIRAILDGDRQNLLASYTAAAASRPDIDGLAMSVREASAQLDSLFDTERIAAELAASTAVDLAAVEALPDDWIFPVRGEHSFVDTYLAPRMTGTPSAHRHQGTDVFAKTGTPLVAVERGVVGRVGEVSLGGLRVWLIGETGTAYYYAHLSSFAPGLEPGQFVEAGTVLGFVGNTGNALTTPPHVHFQVHPDGGSSVNPYPLLAQLSSNG